MGFIHFNRDDKSKKFDHALHCVVFFGIGFLNLMAINAHPDSKLVAGIAGTALGTTWTAAIYHLGLGVQAFMMPTAKELQTGEALRNLLTTLSIVLVTANIGVISSSDVSFGLKFGGTANEKVMAYSALSLLGLLLARFLDMMLDHDELKGLLSIDEVKVAGYGNDNVDAEPMWGKTALNGRIFMTQFLLLGTVATSMMLWVGGDYRLDNTTSGDDLLMTLGAILTLVHFALYPLALLLGMNKRFKDNIVKCLTCCGKIKKEEEDAADLTIESWNRVPLIRWVVTTTVIFCFAFLAGHTFDNERSQLVLINLVSYVAADQVGRHVV